MKRTIVRPSKRDDLAPKVKAEKRQTTKRERENAKREAWIMAVDYKAA